MSEGAIIFKRMATFDHGVDNQVEVVVEHLLVVAALFHIVLLLNPAITPVSSHSPIVHRITPQEVVILIVVF